MYSKLVDGLIRFHELGRVMRYVQSAIDDNCTMKQEVIVQLDEIYGDDERYAEIL